MQAYKASVAAAEAAIATNELLTENGMSLQDLNEDSSESDSDEIEYFCELCEKVFKNEKSLMNHQTSKLHLKMVEKYSAELNELSDNDDENQLLNDDVENDDAGKVGSSKDTSESKADNDIVDQSETSSDENAFDPNDLKCLFCNKDFKTINAKESHERSKKHRDVVKKAKIEMEKEARATGETDSSSHQSSKTTKSHSSKKEKATKSDDSASVINDAQDDEFLHR